MQNKIRRKQKRKIKKYIEIEGSLFRTTGEYGFVIPDPKYKLKRDIFVPARGMKNAFHKDKVRVYVKAGSLTDNQRMRGEIIEVIQAAKNAIIGKIKKHHNHWAIMPLSENLDYFVLIDKPPHGLKENQIASFYLKQYPDKGVPAIGEVIDIIGYENDPEIDEKIVISKFEIMPEFPKEVLKEAESKKIIKNDYKNRTDLRKELIFTIDGEDAKDFDDAVSIKRFPEGRYELGVHIADVSHYVREQSRLDGEAFRRGTSIYFPDRAIPMLPAHLSEELCSLQPEQDRFTISVKILFNAQGSVKNYSIFKSVIRSKFRLNYNLVQNILDNPGSDEFKDKKLVHSLLLMNKLARLLTSKRTARGALDFDLPEPQIEFDQDLQISGIHKTVRLDSHRLIEEFMITANEIIAQHLTNLKIPAIYRVHEIPEAEKVLQFLEAFENLGYAIPSKIKHDQPGLFQKILMQTEGKPESNFVSYIMLRSFKQARYVEKNLGHFGLASKCYTHFTSPIRRYPDLIVHRILSKVLVRQFKEENKEYYAQNMARIAEQCSSTERKAVEAERYIVNMKRARFIQQFVGQTFDGIISGLSNRKLFIEIIDHFVEGFVPINTLQGDSYSFDENIYAVIGRRYGKRYKLGNKVKVTLIAAEPLRCQIELRIGS